MVAKILKPGRRIMSRTTRLIEVIVAAGAAVSLPPLPAALRLEPSLRPIPVRTTPGPLRPPLERRRP
jgi:hypothetical protein